MSASALAFLAALPALIPLGIAGAWLPGVRSLPLLARLAFALLMGALLLTLTATLLSLLGWPWSLPGLIAPPLLLNGLAAIGLRRLARGADPPLPAPPPLALVVIALGTLHLALMLATSRATSIDFTYFWGVKAVHYAEHRGIDEALLRWPFFLHAVPDYPPLVPVTQAFGVLLAGRMPWVAAPLTAAIWHLATLPLVFALLARPLGRVAAGSVAAFWYVALAASMAASFSGANGEAPLLAFETVAAMTAIASAHDSRWLAPCALLLASAVLTKVEGSVFVAAVIGGVFLRDLAGGKTRALGRAFLLASAPIAALGLWFAYQWRNDLPIGFTGHGRFGALHWANAPQVLAAFPGNLTAGTFGLSWVIALTLLALAWPNRRRLPAYLPLLLPAGALFAFFVFDYLHEPVPPIERIGWSLPRISQPALSALILAAGWAHFDPPTNEDA